MNNLIENDVLNEYNNLVKNDNLLPIKISEFYMKKVVDEVNHIGVGDHYINLLYLQDKK